MPKKGELVNRLIGHTVYFNVEFNAGMAAGGFLEYDTKSARFIPRSVA